MKLKTLRKKIRRLETRLQEGPKKLARLKRKLEALVTADAEKAKRRLAARAAEARQTMKSATPAQSERRLATEPQSKAADVPSQSAAQKVKKKLNLSPERRAQLAAAMKARWAAKRAAMAAKPQNNSPKRDFTPGQVPQAP